MLFSPATKQAIWNTSNSVASDMDEPYNGNAVCVAESTFDCLSVYEPDASAEVSRLIDAHGYDAVLADAIKIVCVA